MTRRQITQPCTACMTMATPSWGSHEASATPKGASPCQAGPHGARLKLWALNPPPDGEPDLTVAAARYHAVDWRHFVEQSVGRTTGAAYLCGFDAISDRSSRFAGFAPGYRVVVVGAFNKKGIAEDALRQMTSCVPEAYLKHASYGGG